MTNVPRRTVPSSPGTTPPDPPVPGEASENGWAEGIRRGDSAAFELTFRRYHRLLCAFAFQYVRSPEIAEDIVGDTFTRLWTDRERLPNPVDLRLYLTMAARNRAISWLRSERVRDRWREGEAQIGPGTERPYILNTAERQLDRTALHAAIERAIAHLPDRCREALALRWRHGLSYSDIAEVLGVSIKSVEVYVSRGLAVLREQYHTLLPYR